MSTSTRPTSEEVTAVVWDFGNVLIGWAPDRAVIGRYTPAEWEDFRVRARFDELNRRADAGLSHAVGIAELEAQDPWLAEVYRHYTTNFAASLTGPVPGVADLVRAVHARGLRQYGLTNWAAEDFHHARRSIPVLGMLDAVVVSGIEGVAKPDPRIFQVLVDRHGLVPERSAFVDDSPANVATAAGLGFRALHFTSAPGLRAALAQLGVLPSA